MNDENVTIQESLGMFNTLSVEIRKNFDTLAKQILFLSAGVQSITIGAFLNGTPPKFSDEAIAFLRYGWLFLSVSIVLCLVFMLTHAVSMTTVGFTFQKKLEDGRAGVEILKAPILLRVFTRFIGLLAFLSCAGGVVLLSLAAMSLIGVQKNP
jgi:hypothetical protein